MSGTTGIAPGIVAPGAPDPNPDQHVLHHNNIDALLWLQTSAEAFACYVQTFELAKLRVTQALTVPPPAGRRWCVFSDLDETLLDNSAYNEWLVTAGRNFQELGSWAEYVNQAISIATPGALEFAAWLGRQRDPAGQTPELFYVTSRLDSIWRNGARIGPGVREATVRNLAALGFPLPDGSDDPARTHLFMKNQPIDGQPTDKFAQYAHVQATRGAQPILWLGDNAADFDPRFRPRDDQLDWRVRVAVAEQERARWGSSWLQFPNPVYGGFLQYLRDGSRTALADDANAGVAGPARLPRSADGAASQGRITEKVRALAPWAPAAEARRGVDAPPKAAGHLRFASFNVENLFSRARALNKDDEADGGRVLTAAAELQRLLEAETYDRRRILEVFNANELYAFLTVRSDRVNAEGARSPRFFFHTDPSDWSPAESINTAIKGRADWTGAIEFRRDAFAGAQIEALARIILGVGADVLVLVEVEDRRALEAFNIGALGNRYPRVVLFDGNDERGIDVALLTTLPVGCIRTNVFTLDPGADAPPRADGTAPRLFNRDCLEVEVELPGIAGPVAFLCNHLKSKSGGPQGERDTDPKRIRQSAEIARIIGARYAPGGVPRRVVVAGDLNESPTRNGGNGANLGGAKTSIDALLTGGGLANVLRDRLGNEAWTYVLERGANDLRQQIDYLLVSPDLAGAVRQAGVERSGQPNTGTDAPAPGDAASDHALIWLDIDPAAVAP